MIDDPYLHRMKYRRLMEAREAFSQMSQPFYDMLYRLELTHSRLRMTFDKDGQWLRTETLWDECAITSVQEIQDCIDQCQRIAESILNKEFP